MSVRLFHLLALAVLGLSLSTGLVGCSKDDDHPTAPSVANLVVTPSTWDFGSVGVGTGSSKQFTLTNTGTAAFTGVVTENGADFNIPDFGSGSFTLQPNATATFHVTFSPASAGAKSCTLTTGSGGPSVTLSGSGS